MSRTFIRYSLAFKQKVVSEIESGQLSIGEAQHLYDIRGHETIQKWIGKLGKIGSKYLLRTSRFD